MLGYLTSRPGRIGAIVAFTLVAAVVIPAAPALAATGEGCPNEQVRDESNVNFITGQPYSAGLPECRAYEMVSPPEKGGSDAETGDEVGPGGIGTSSFPAAADGDAVSFTSQNAFGDAENAIIGGVGASQDSYVARRGTLGWTTSSMLPPRSLITLPQVPIGDASPEAFATLESCGNQTANNENIPAGNVLCALRESEGSPWVSTPLYSNSTGHSFGRPGSYDKLVYAGGSSDLSHVVFESKEGEEGGAFLPSDSSHGGHGIYEVSGLGGLTPKLSLVNVDNAGAEIGPEDENAKVGGSSLSKSSASSSYQAISSDGSTVYFTSTPAGGVPTIFARINEASTVAISNPSPSQCTTCTSTPEPAVFEGASADGSKVFFLTTQQLVNSDTDSAVDLYEYDFNKPSGQNLIQLSKGGPGDPTPGSGAEVQGVVRVSSDGSHVYFVAKGVLTGANPEGHAPELGADNLYVVETETGKTSFIAELCSNASSSGAITDPECPTTLDAHDNDSLLWGQIIFINGSDAISGRHSQTPSNGRYLAFTTYARLISAGPEADSNEAQQVYRYDSQTGHLIRISIGEPAFPASQNGNTPGMNATIAASVDEDQNGGNIGAHANANDWNRQINEDGTEILFATPARLQADDVNTGTEPSCKGGNGCDVYEWHECEGGACEDGMAGEVHMITPGDDLTSGDTDSGAASMSASGSDIFFFTQIPLVGQDKDSLVDVYDARVNGGFPAPTPELSCSGEACQGSASPGLALGASGTSSFTGGGNLTPGSTSFPPPTVTSKVSIGKHSVKGATITLSVKAPAGGHISASGSGVASVKRSVSKSGTYVLKATLTRAGKASLRKHHRLKLKIRVAFTPTSGQASAAAITITVKT